MNESFEVILNNEEFQNYKQLQKNADLSDKALRELRRDIENYKLRCDQQQLALSNYELKIKELSKNSIRLSRRLMAEQEEHFATQENFLAREKQLLEKLLTLSNDHENGAAILLTVRDAKGKLETENGALKRKITDQEKEMESLSQQSKQLKKQLVALSDRCTAAEGQQLIALKQRDCLKVRVDELSLEMQSSLREMEEKLQAHQANHHEQIKKITQAFQKQMKQAESKCKQLLDEKTHQIKQLSQQLSESQQESSLLKKRVGILQSQLKDMRNKHQDNVILLSQLMIKIEELQIQGLNQTRDIKQCLKQFAKSIKNDGAALNNMLLKYAAASAEKIQEASINNQQKLLENVWKFMHRQLETIRQQLKKDQIAEQQIILTLQFSRAITQLKIQMDKQLSNVFNSWLTK